MGNLTETPSWSAGVYQIEETDPLHGGVPNRSEGQGQLNWPTTDLANRTAWLKQKCEAIEQLLNDLTNGAPGALDTLNELAAALGDDPNFAATILGKVGDAAPKGVVAPLAMTAPPTGWLECDGAQISRTSYAALFAAIGTTFGAGDGSNTFHLPDLRGEFLRGWDNGRGVDSGRSLGALQSGMIAEGAIGFSRNGPTGPFNTLQNAPVNFDGTNSAPERAAAELSDGDNGTPPPYTPDGHYRIVSPSGVQISGNETRPRNVALMFCIKF